MDPAIWGRRSDYFAEGPVSLKLEFNDMLERPYVWQQEIDPARDHGPLKIGSEMSERTVEALKNLTLAVEQAGERLAAASEPRVQAQGTEADGYDFTSNTEVPGWWYRTRPG